MTGWEWIMVGLSCIALSLIVGKNNPFTAINKYLRERKKKRT